MSSASYPIVTGSKKGIQLDPRTKLLLLLTITTLMFSTSNEGIMNLVKPLLSLVPFILILSERRDVHPDDAVGRVDGLGHAFIEVFAPVYP